MDSRAGAAPCRLVELDSVAVGQYVGLSQRERKDYYYVREIADDRGPILSRKELYIYQSSPSLPGLGPSAKRAVSDVNYNTKVLHFAEVELACIAGSVLNIARQLAKSESFMLPSHAVEVKGRLNGLDGEATFCFLYENRPSVLDLGLTVASLVPPHLLTWFPFRSELTMTRNVPVSELEVGTIFAGSSLMQVHRKSHGGLDANLVGSTAKRNLVWFPNSFKADVLSGEDVRSVKTTIFNEIRRIVVDYDKCKHRRQFEIVMGQLCFVVFVPYEFTHDLLGLCQFAHSISAPGDV